jgi:hypothetical protein
MAATLQSTPPPANGTKRKADEASPASNKKKQQKTLEEVIPDASKREEVKAALANEDKDDKPANGTENGEGKPDTNGGAGMLLEQQCFMCWIADTLVVETAEPETKQESNETNAFDKVHADENDEGKTAANAEEANGHTEEANGHTEETEQNGTTKTGDAIEEDQTREEAQPSNILEKGIIYFFTRGRVGTDNPDSVQDLQRSFMVMHPLPAGAKITDGTVQEMNNLRLLALPKKVWPKGPNDKFMSFVEKAGTSMAELKDNFFKGSEYSTKTTGTNHTPNVSLVGEGVYAFTNTGGGRGAAHLVYMLTVPSSLGEVQQDIGLKEKGSFVISLKNPEAPGPANASLPQKPDWPKEFIEEFGGRGWMPAEPKHLDYANAQILMIGEDFESSDNLEAKPKDEKDESKEVPEEELKKLEGEEEERIKHMKGEFAS